MTDMIRVWDLPLRLFHWLLALAVTAALVTGWLGGNLIVWHGRLGLLILGLLFSAFESLNKDHTLAEEKTLDRSVCYRPMIRLADSLFPLLEWAKEQVSIDEQELWSDNSPER